MNQPNLLQKNLNPAFEFLNWPALLISLVFHGLLLMIPIPYSLHKPAEPSQEKHKEENVKITQLLTPPSQPLPKPSAEQWVGGL